METNNRVELELQTTQKIFIYLFILKKKIPMYSQNAYTFNKSMRRLCLDSWLDTEFQMMKQEARNTYL